MTEAWSIPGWTAQNPVYPTGSASSVALPAGAHPLVITGAWTGPKGGAEGTVRFIPRTNNIQVGTVEIVLAPVRFQVTKGVLIDASITVVPQAVVWEVHEAVGPVREVYAVSIPSTAVSPLDISVLARV